MNLEVEHLLYYLGYSFRYQFFILIGAIKDQFESDTEEWSGIISKIKINQKYELNILRNQIDRKIDQNQEKIES